MKAIVWTDLNRWKAGKRKTGHFTENPLWIAYRMNLLRHYCAESVHRQTYRTPHAPHHAVLFNPITKQIVTEYVAPFRDPPAFLFGKTEEKDFLYGLVNPGDWVAMIRLDSDDMYHPEAVKDFVNFGELELKRGRFPKYAYFRMGYAYSYHSRVMRAYDTHCVGPFFCHYWEGADLLKYGRIGDPLMHHQVQGVRLGNRRFIVGMHKHNTSSGMGNKFTGTRIIGLQYRAVKEIYGL